MKRRDFFKKTTVAALGLGIAGTFPVPGYSKIKGVNRKLNIAQVGVSGMQGDFHLNGTSTENRFALCDVDTVLLDPVCEANPNAKRFIDWRDMLDEVGDQIDAIVVSTPDHAHAPVSCAAMRRGIHCYCEKPLAHTVSEIRTMQKLAKEKNLVTQMGTQIHAGSNYRRVVEQIRAGVIGDISEIHVWVPTVWGGSPATDDDIAPPKTLNWDLWIGGAPMRKYQPCYFGGNWRSFWDFGNGAMGDMACHYMDLPFWALGLTYPKTIEPSHLAPPDPDFAPKDLSVRYTFDQKNGYPVTLTWYDGKRRPPILPALNLSDKNNGVLFVGTEGAIWSNYSSHILLPSGKEPIESVDTIPESIGHHAEWIEAIKNGSATDATTCNFEYSGRLAETVLLGPLSYRCNESLEYDSAKMEITNSSRATQYLNAVYRDGWGLDF